MIFVIFAWMVQLGEKIGLVKTEPQTADGRAYQRSQECVQWLRHHLSGCQVLDVHPDQVTFLQSGEERKILFKEHRLKLQRDPSSRLGHSRLTGELFFNAGNLRSLRLAAGSQVLFAYSEGQLRVDLAICDDTLGRTGIHRAQVSFYAPCLARPPDSS